MKGGLLCQKKEMTKVWKDGKQQAVTLLSLVPQQVVRYKTIEKDGYAAAVVGSYPMAKEDKVSYKSMCEFTVDGAFEEAFQVGSDVSVALVE
jgi:ribosomal protein L3